MEVNEGSSGEGPNINVSVDVEELPPPTPPEPPPVPVVTEPVILGETPDNEQDMAYRMGRLEGLINNCLEEQRDLSERVDTYIASHIAVHEVQEAEIQSIESTVDATQEAVAEIGEEVMPDGESRPTPLWCKLLGAK